MLILSTQSLNLPNGMEILPDENRLNTERKTGAAYKSPFTFKKHGQSGLPVSDLFPHVAKHADDLCVIRSMRADVSNHEPSLMLMNCGDGRLVRPSMGSGSHMVWELRIKIFLDS